MRYSEHVSAAASEELRFACAACGEINTVAIEPEDGEAQEFVVDCWVCCRPLRVRCRGASVQVQLDA